MENHVIDQHDPRYHSSESSNSSSADDLTMTDSMDGQDGPLSFFMKGDEDGRFSTTQGGGKSVDGQMITVGVCAMAKKTNSKPMKEILGRLNRFEHLQIIVFDEKMILNEPVEKWPIVDALISFFSTGFPLQKAIEYKHLRQPFVVNELESQYTLFDRREVYKILVREGIAHPRYAVMNRDTTDQGTAKDHFEENEDAIDVNGVTFQRPFVEKPVCAEDHNIYIYFPVSAGGGCQRLFRKVGSRSSVYSTINRVRKTGSYVYEDFMPTDGTDVKVYTVGPDYAHAEARKSPALDGKVERDKDGKEIRYPVLLSASEKMTARKVCMAFKQNVCGFDLLRASGKSYVCDVNGFSFVKNSTKYYDDCANVLGTMIIRALAPQLHIPLVLGAAPEDIPVVHTTSGSMMELRCVVAVIRHGDRTPKQKMKMEVKNRKFFVLFEKYGGYKTGHLKLKKPKQLQEILDIARDLLTESQHDHNPEVQEKKAKLQQLKLVLEMYGHFSGINRKVQLKYQPRGAPKRSSSEEDEHPREPSLVLIVKWGGELTPAGKFQAEDLGKAFRTLYPGGQGEFETPGLGFLRLHSTFRHDLKIYASDEGRVQMTAAAFTKGLLALEGELTPILVSMVKSANTNGLLDKEGETSKYLHVVKEKLMEMLNKDQEFSEEDKEKLCPTGSMALLNAMKFIDNPRKMCDRVFEMVKEITARIKLLKMELKSRDLKLYHGESWELLIRRWAKLEKDFKTKAGNYDISKIPDIYDCIKYDLQHNQKTLQYDRAEELFMCSKALADIVIPQEYGITVEEKLHISQSICTPLMRKIHSDLLQVCQQNAEEESTRLNSKYSKGVASPERFVRTRLYFTSESHIHSLLNMFRFGGLFDPTKDEQWKKATDFLSNTSELNYMTQINIMMFEDPSKEFTSPERFHIELHFSPGAYTSCDTDVMNPVSSGYRTIFHSRHLKKSDEHHVSSENGIKEGIIHEETIREEDGQEELFPSTEDPKNAPCVYRVHIHETETAINHLGERTLNKPLILIDKVTKSDIGMADSVNVADVVSTATTAGRDTGATAGLATTETPSEVTLCPETVDSVGHVESGLDESKRVKRAPESEKQDLVQAGETALSKTEDKSLENKTEVEADTNTEIGVKRKKRSSVTFDLSRAESDRKEAAKDYNSDETGAAEKDISNVDSDIGKTDENKDGVTGSQSQDVTARKPMFTMGSQDNLEELVESLLNSDGERDVESQDDNKKSNGQELFVQGSESIPEPKSPDPDIPEWDWGDNSSDLQDETKDETASEDKSESTPSTKEGLIEEPPSTKQSREQEETADSIVSPSAVSKPITIDAKPVMERKRTGSFDSLKTYEEGRSRSLEDKIDDGVGGSRGRQSFSYPCRYSLSDLFSMGNGELFDFKTLMEKHYLTIHLPINKDRHHHSFSSLLYLNPEAFRAFDGFNMVPSLKPLETLHNNLTLKDMDGFLSRATTFKFFTPVSSPMYGATPLVSPRLPEAKRHKSSSLSLTCSLQSLPSSSNSSAGPSSPTSATTPVDFFSKLKMFMLNSQKIDLEQYTDREVQATSDSDLPSGSSSASDISSSKNNGPCASSKSDLLCSSTSSLSKLQNSIMDNLVKQNTSSAKEIIHARQTLDRKSEKDCSDLQKKDSSPSEKEIFKDDEQKTITAKGPAVFQSKKSTDSSTESKGGIDVDSLTSDIENKVNITGPNLPTSLIQKIPPQLTELDVSQESHKSAFKKVGKRFKMTQVSEESLKLQNSSQRFVTSTLSNESTCRATAAGSLNLSDTNNPLKGAEKLPASSMGKEGDLEKGSEGKSSEESDKVAKTADGKQ